MSRARVRSLAAGSSWSAVPSATRVGTGILAISRPAASWPYHQSVSALAWLDLTTADGGAAGGYAAIAAWYAACAWPWLAGKMRPPRMTDSGGMSAAPVPGNVAH